MLEQIHSNLLLSLLTQIDLQAEGAATFVYLLCLGLLYWLSVVVKDYYNLDDVNARYNVYSNWVQALRRPKHVFLSRIALHIVLGLLLGGGLAGLWYLEIPYPKPGNSELPARTYFVFVLFALLVWVVYALEVALFGPIAFTEQEGLEKGHKDNYFYRESFFWAEVAVAFFTLDKDQKDALIADLWTSGIHVRITTSKGSRRPTPAIVVDVRELRSRIDKAELLHESEEPFFVWEFVTPVASESRPIQFGLDRAQLWRRLQQDKPRKEHEYDELELTLPHTPPVILWDGYYDICEAMDESKEIHNIYDGLWAYKLGQTLTQDHKDDFVNFLVRPTSS